MVSFELDEELRKMFFRLVTSVGWRKILSPHEESNLRPSDLRSDALPLSHQDSSMSEIYYEVLITRVLHTARISNVDSVMFLIEIVEMVSFELDEELRKMFFLSCHKRGIKKNSESPWRIFFTEHKTYIGFTIHEKKKA